MIFSKNRLQNLLLQVSFIGTFSETMTLPMWSIITNRVGGSVLEAGIGYALFSIFTGLVVVIAGRTKWFEENLKFMVFMGFLIAGIGDISYLLASNVWELFIVQSMIGMAVGLLNPAWDGLYSDEIEEGETGKMWALWTGGVSFVVGFAALLGTVMASLFGIPSVFITMGCFDLIAVLISYRIWKKTEEE